MSCHVFLTVTLFPKNIEGNFNLILPFKIIYIMKAAANYTMQYQLNFSEIEESNITFWYRAKLFLYLNNKKKSLTEPCQDYILHFQCTSLSNYLNITFIIIKGHLNRKTLCKMFLKFYLVI